MASRYHADTAGTTLSGMTGCAFGCDYGEMGNCLGAEESVGGVTLPTSYFPNPLNQYSSTIAPSTVALLDDASPTP